ncbi:MAG: alpha/beta hydrolase [Burkholderiales bacterium]
MTSTQTLDVELPANGARLPGTLALPPAACGVVLFAHGSGSSRLSPRNAVVARALHGAGVGTLLFDLLTPGEDVDVATRFDIPLLAGRLAAATAWLMAQPQVAGVPVGWFGASTGAGAALLAAAAPACPVRAIVSRGGRPDLAGARALAAVRAPTLLIVGGEDHDVIALNRAAYAHLRCPKALEIVPGATHLFVEPGTLAEVAALAAAWFARWLGAADRTSSD